MRRHDRRDRPSARASARLPLAGAVVILVVAAVVLGLMAWHRPLDGDEGYYAAAAGLTAEGARPYADYFYPQAPLLPWLYAPVVALAGPSLRALRWLSAVLVFTTFLVWAWHLLRGTRRTGTGGAAALAALAVLVASPEQLAWGVTVKTYALTGLLATVSLVALARGLQDRSRVHLWLAAAGAAMGVAGGVRLFFAPLGPVMAVGLVLWPGGRRRRAAATEAAWLLAGCVLGSLPSLVALVQDPSVFLFDNLGYHEVRFSELRDAHPDAGWGLRLAAGAAGAGRVLLTRPYLVFVLALAIAGVAAIRREEEPVRRWLAIDALVCAVFFLGCMLPDPVHAQYFTAPLVTLALPLAAAGLRRYAAGTRAAAAVSVAAVTVALAAGFVLRSGMDPDPLWSFASYDAVVDEIQGRTEPDDVVLAFWPGYAFGAGRRHLPGMENQFGIGVSEELDADRRRQVRIAGRYELMEAMAAGTPRLVILGTWMNEVNTALDEPQMAELLAVFHRHYRVVAMKGDVQICVRRDER